ncbi:MAG: hypothetical protein R3A48_10970 [Polyangiales bacterium]
MTETTFPEVSLPDATAMAGFDTLEVDLSTHCVNHRDGDCGAWDYISDLRLCELPDADAGADAGAPRCDAEIARWITTYWREGRWVTDISPMLPLLREGGRRRFRWYASRQFDPRPANYVVSLSLRFSNRSRPLRPFAVERVAWPGGRLNTTYGERNPAFRFTPRGHAQGRALHPDHRPRRGDRAVRGVLQPPAPLRRRRGHGALAALP